MANKIRLSCSYDVCAAHVLRRDDWDTAKNETFFGQCARVHGHQYKLEIFLTGLIEPDTGMLINGYSVDALVKEKILSKIDHHFLNEDVDFFKTHLPTAEWIAVWVFGELSEAFPQSVKLAAVRVYETPALYAEFSG